MMATHFNIDHHASARLSWRGPPGTDIAGYSIYGVPRGCESQTFAAVYIQSRVG